MSTIYKTKKELEKYCKSLETQTMNRAGRSLTFTGIMRHLLQDSVVSIEDGVFKLDADKFKQAKIMTRAYLKENYPTQAGGAHLEYEFQPGLWWPVEPENLTGDEKNLEILRRMNPAELNNSKWFWNRNYHTQPRRIRVVKGGE